MSSLVFTTWFICTLLIVKMETKGLKSERLQNLYHKPWVFKNPFLRVDCICGNSTNNVGFCISTFRGGKHLRKFKLLMLDFENTPIGVKIFGKLALLKVDYEQTMLRVESTSDDRK